jgi:hypothetical protein
MAFSPQKSLFLEVGWEEEDLALLKVILPFEVKPVEDGFKYLGCFLKPNCYINSDWNWLVKKFEKRIANWSHRWLSLGGRVTLGKVVLESILVYWLSFAKIPKSILNTIRRKMFSFLWTGKKIKEGIHLISWNKIAKPKKMGGWGIKNIFTFGKALAAKSLWRCLMVPGLWHEVILKKYLKKKSVVEWLREGRKSRSGISNIWRALTSSLSIITDWLKCCPQRLSNFGCFCIKDSSSQVESSAGSFLHLMRYSEMDLFLSWRILVSVMASGSNMIFPSSSSFGNIV